METQSDWRLLLPTVFTPFCSSSTLQSSLVSFIVCKEEIEKKKDVLRQDSESRKQHMTFPASQFFYPSHFHFQSFFGQPINQPVSACFLSCCEAGRWIDNWFPPLVYTQFHLRQITEVCAYLHTSQPRPTLPFFSLLYTHTHTHKRGN